MNAKYVREEILKKNSSQPYYVDNSIYVIQNDYDTFPYPRWFRSDVKSHKVYVAEREAGWVPKNTFKPVIPKEEVKKPSTCFQNPCSIVYPCYAPEANYISSNKVCVIEHQ
jgi:hypothetical protein